MDINITSSLRIYSKQISVNPSLPMNTEAYSKGFELKDISYPSLKKKILMVFIKRYEQIYYEINHVTYKLNLTLQVSINILNNWIINFFNKNLVYFEFIISFGLSIPIN